MPYERFYPTIEKLKREFPHLRIAVHSALLDEVRAKRMESAGVDVAMMDVIGAQETIRDVYHLDRPVADFEATLAALSATKMEVVPHIVIGLHYGRLLGEENALDIIARYQVAALILVVVSPIYAPADKPFATIGTDDVAKVFVAARQRIHNAPVQLGCIRPAGLHKLDDRRLCRDGGLRRHRLSGRGHRRARPRHRPAGGAGARLLLDFAQRARRPARLRRMRTHVTIETPDVLVVGLGPAGSRAAEAAARAGLARRRAGKARASRARRCNAPNSCPR